MECCVKLTSFKLIPFGDQKQKFLPQCKILLPSPTGLRWDRELCVGRAWEWPWTVPEPGSGQGPFLLFIICYLLVSSTQCGMKTLRCATSGPMDLPAAQGCQLHKSLLCSRFSSPAFPC